MRGGGRVMVVFISVRGAPACSLVAGVGNGASHCEHQGPGGTLARRASM